jgi:hypothetical protein
VDEEARERRRLEEDQAGEGDVDPGPERLGGVGQRAAEIDGAVVFAEAGVAAIGAASAAAPGSAAS